MKGLHENTIVTWRAGQQQPCLSPLLYLVNVGPDLMEGFGLMKSFGEIIQNQLLFEGFGIMKSFGNRNKKIADSES